MITLYAQPRGIGILLDHSNFSRGRFVESDGSKMVTTVFTDVCSSILRYVRTTYPDTVINVDKPNGYTNATWIVTLHNNAGTITMRRDHYRGLSFENVTNYFTTIKFNMNQEIIQKIVLNTVNSLGHPPYEMEDWHRFTQKTNITRDEVIRNWHTFMQNTSTHRNEEETPKKHRICVKCKKNIPWDAHLCPYCGKKYKNMLSEVETKKITQSKQKNTQYCSECRYKLEGNEKYCPECGNTVM